ncbi:MAG: hypothetical protein AAGK22_15965 [Acidobacteriota bacterium]
MTSKPPEDSRDRDLSLEALVDLARGLGDPAETTRAGRERTEASSKALRAFSELAAATDLSSEVAETEEGAAALRATRSLAGLHHAPMVAAVQEIVQGAAGLRSERSAERRLRLRSKGVVVEVLVDPQSVQDGVVVVGELFGDSPERPALSNVPVVLQDDDRVLASLRSCSDGEFQADVRAEGNLTLSILLPQDEVLRIPLLEGTL